MKFLLGLCVAISTILFPTQEPQKPGLQRPPIGLDREIVIQNLPDLSGLWHLYSASEKNIPSRNERTDFQFKRVDKITDTSGEELHSGAGQYTVLVITESGKEFPFHEARFNGQALLIRTRILKTSRGPRELPGLVMDVVGDHFEGYMTDPDGTRMGRLLKLVKSKQQVKDSTK